MDDHAPATVVLITKSPNLDHLRQTLHALRSQTAPPAEVVLVDSTPGGPPFVPETDGCSMCNPAVSELLLLEEQGVAVEIEHAPDLGIGGATRRGMDLATQEYIIHLDEDDVLLSRDWLEHAVERLRTEDGLTGVGGVVVEPLEDTATATLASWLGDKLQVPAQGHNILHPRHLCDGDQCVFIDQHRGEDQTLRRRLRQAGRLERDPHLRAAKHLPTRRQELARDLTVATIGGGLLGALASRLA